MATEIKVDKVDPSSGTTLQIGTSGDTITIPTGATFTITDGLGVAGGGTGLTSFTAGDVLYATGTTTLAKLAKGSDDDVLTLASGVPSWAAAAGGGKVLQVQQLVYETAQTLGINDADADSGLTLAITPSASSSKILISGFLTCGTDAGFGGFGWILKRDTTVIGTPTSGGSGVQNRYHVSFLNPFQAVGASTVTPVPFEFLDSPSTTSATTYTLTARGVSGTSNIYVNRSSVTTMVYTSILTLMEIGA
jgi:hypothetical protein